MSIKAKKFPPLKKRHTKPCKYFQFGLCTNTAEECNFAHVAVVPNLTYPPSMQGLRGPGCGHDVNAISPVSHTSSYPGACNYANPYSLLPSYYYHPWASAPIYQGHPGSFPVASPEIPTNVQSPDVKSRPYPVAMSMTSPRLDTSCVDFDSGNGAPGLARKEDNEKTDCDGPGNPNVNQVNHHGDVVFTEDPQFAEHQHIQHQSRVHVEDREPTSFDEVYRHRSGRYAMHDSPVCDTGRMSHQEQWVGAGGNRNLATRDTRRNTFRSASRKTAKYKTKPCKFYTVENGCPNGDRCTFIHGTDVPPVPPMMLGHSQNQRPRRKSDSYLQTPFIGAFKNNRETYNDKPRVDTSGAEDNKEKKKDFFPITWRVIGGGVLIGGKRAENSGERDLSTDQGEEAEEVHDDDKSGNVNELDLPRFSHTNPKRRSRSLSPSLPADIVAMPNKGVDDNWLTSKTT